MCVDKELPVSVWPEWKIIEKIGEGSFGKVYKAQRTEKGHSFYSAIKIISIPASKSELNSVRQETEDEKSTREYFENVVEECIQEVSTMEYFRGNSHIVSVEDFKVMEYLDEIGWDIYIRMEYLTSFTDYCAGKNLTEKEVLKLGIDLCRALEYCGQLHIIHRDIKPENIFVSRFGDFKLGDFGIARELEKTMSSLSKKGTYSYMAPEMYRGENYDRRADIYSLGLMLYKLMNHNRLPFLNLEKQLITYRDKENALTRRMSGEKLPKPADAGDGFAKIITKACAYDAGKRYQDPKDFRKDLEDLLEGRASHTGMEPADGQIPADAQGTYRVQGANGAQASEGRQRFVTEAPSVSELQPVRNERQKSGTDPRGNVQEVQKRTKALWRKKNRDESDIFSRTIVPGRDRGRWNRYRNSAIPWIAAIVIALAGCIMVGAYLKVMLEDTVREQTEKMVNALQNEKYGADKEDTGEDFATSVKMISERATTIVNELDTYTREGKEGERLRYYNEDGQIMKVLVYPALSSDNVYEEYYYWNGALFFAYIWKDNESELYYYRDGMLIRWIDEDGTCHDNDWDDQEYVERGDKYWLKSIEQLQ